MQKSLDIEIQIYRLQKSNGFPQNNPTGIFRYYWDIHELFGYDDIYIRLLAGGFKYLLLFNHYYCMIGSDGTHFFWGQLKATNQICWT